MGRPLSIGFWGPWPEEVAIVEAWTGPGQIAVILLALVFALGIILLTLWVTLPFGVFGTKPLLRELIAAQQETNRKLEQVRRLLQDIEAGRSWPSGTRPRGGVDY